MPLFVTSIDSIINDTLNKRQTFARMKDDNSFHTDFELRGMTKWYHQRQSFVRLISNAKIEKGRIPVYNTNPNGQISGTNISTNYDYNGNTPPTSNAPTQNGQVPVQISTTADYDTEIRNNWILTGGTEINGQLPSGFGQLYSSDRNLPLPGITEVTVQNKGAFGSTREAKIKFTCHTIEQLEMLEMLYMTFGVFCVLEFGWSLLPDGSYNTYTITPDDMKMGLTSIEQSIPKKVKDSKGHYDAMMGKISAFTWANNSTGGYDCETTLISMAGSFLQMDTRNSTRGFGVDSKNGTYLNPISNIEQGIRDLRQLIKDTGTNNITTYKDTKNNNIEIPIGFIRNFTSDKESESGIDAYVTWGVIEDYLLTHALGMVSPSYIRDFTNQDTLNLYMNSLYGAKVSEIITPFEYKNLFKFPDKTDVGKLYGAVLSPLLLSEIYPYFNSFSTTIFNDPNLYSADPAICILPGQSPSRFSAYSNSSDTIDTPEQDSYMNKFMVPGEPNKGYVRNICVNLDFVEQTYKDSSTASDFVMGMLNQINSACGEPWKFGTFVDERLSNAISVVDLGAWNEKEPKPISIIINGFNSIARNATLNTEVDEKMQAQTMYCTNKDSNGKGISSKIEGYGFWGRSVVDQNFQGALPVTSDLMENPTRKTVDNTPEGMIDTLQKTKKEVYESRRTEESVSAAKQALHNYLVRTSGGATNPNSEEQTPTFTTMLPVKLNMTFDGISGLIFGNALKATPLPQRYNDCWFTITNVSHTLSGNDWTTDVETVLRVRLPKDGTAESNTVTKPKYADTSTPIGNTSNAFSIADTSAIAGKFKNPAKGNYTSKVQARRQLSDGTDRPHKGIDIALRSGGNIVASYDGIVVLVGLKSASAGNYVVIQHTIDGVIYYSKYDHLKNNSIKVKKGDTVKGGITVIGEMGNTGHCVKKPTDTDPTAGTHLHFEIRDSIQGGKVYDPEIAIGKALIGKAI